MRRQEGEPEEPIGPGESNPKPLYNLDEEEGESHSSTQEIRDRVEAPEPALTDNEIVVLAFSYSIIGKRRTSQFLTQMLGLTSKEISAIRESGMQKLVHHYLQRLPDDRVKGLPVHFHSLDKTQKHEFRDKVPKAMQTWYDLSRG